MPAGILYLKIIYLSIFGLSTALAPMISSAAEALFEVEPPCDRSAENEPGTACMRPFGACEQVIDEMADILRQRYDKTVELLDKKGILIDWGQSTSFEEGNGLVGYEYSFCDLNKSAEACEQEYKSCVYQRSGKKLKTKFVKGGSCEMQNAMLFGLQMEAEKCYRMQVLDEARKGPLKITSPACLDLAQDLHVGRCSHCFQVSQV